MTSPRVSPRDGRFAGGRLYYRVWDAPDPKALVVLAHGFAEHSGRYAHVAEPLVGAGFTTWALDHHGHGLSDGDRGDARSPDEAVADMDSLVDMAVAERPGLPVFLVGHSMGGLLAIAYAEEHQDRLAGLVVSGAAVSVNQMLLDLLELDEIPAVPLAPFVSRDPEVVKGYEDDPLIYHGAMPRHMLAEAPTLAVSTLTNPFPPRPPTTSPILSRRLTKPSACGMSCTTRSSTSPSATRSSAPWSSGSGRA